MKYIVSFRRESVISNKRRILAYGFMPELYKQSDLLFLILQEFNEIQNVS